MAFIEDPEDIKEAVHSFYTNLYQEDWVSRPYFKRTYGKAIDDNMASELVENFSKLETWNIIKSCDGNTALGPDGFNMISIKKGWSFMKKNIMAFMGEFYRNCRLPKCINSSFITLIRKVDNPTELKEYRPISLIGCMYKILAKVLAARLKCTIPTVIGEVQSAFSGGKNIQDGILIANEEVDYWKKTKKQGVIIKLDSEKAFDNLNWDFSLNMMQLLGFPQKWVSWIKECLSSPCVFVLVNGSPTKQFQMQKGVRQGDPLSPFLFIIATEGLNWIFKNVEVEGLIKGLVMSNGGPSFNPFTICG